jgi:hypothetical protein
LQTIRALASTLLNSQQSLSLDGRKKKERKNKKEKERKTREKRKEGKKRMRKRWACVGVKKRCHTFSKELKEINLKKKRKQFLRRKYLPSLILNSSRFIYFI